MTPFLLNKIVSVIFSPTLFIIEPKDPLNKDFLICSKTKIKNFDKFSTHILTSAKHNIIMVLAFKKCEC